MDCIKLTFTRLSHHTFLQNLKKFLNSVVSMTFLKFRVSTKLSNEAQFNEVKTEKIEVIYIFFSD